MVSATLRYDRDARLLEREILEREFALTSANNIARRWQVLELMRGLRGQKAFP
jgi:hypothetical protein